jgi:hypothetical protein
MEVVEVHWMKAEGVSVEKLTVVEEVKEDWNFDWALVELLILLVMLPPEGFWEAMEVEDLLQAGVCYVMELGLVQVEVVEVRSSDLKEEAQQMSFYAHLEKEVEPQILMAAHPPLES